MRIEKINKVGTKIDTAWGKALYSHTEVEDKNGNWDDHWKVSDGEYVVHCIEQHHIFLIMKPEMSKDRWVMSILSDVQELIRMGMYKEANEKVNSAKKVVLGRYKVVEDGFAIEVL